MSDPETRTHGVESARRVLQMLLAFSASRPTATVEDLAAAAGTTTSTTYRYLSLLRELSLVEEKTRGTYALSPRVLALARAVNADQAIANLARPVLRGLTDETGETATLIQRTGDSAVCVESSPGDHPIRLSFSTGDLFPMHRGAAAKVLLATLSPAKQAAYLARVVPTMGEKEVAALLEELAAVRRAGHAESSGEVDDGVWATAAAVHSRGKVVAAISVAAPQYRIGPQDRERIAGLVLDAAARLDRALATPA